MRDFPANRTRNIAIMGHSGTGKTRFAEACLFNAKLIDRMAKHNDASILLDADPEEIRRKISINTSLASMEWDNKKFTWIDTPGDFDFAGETLSALRVADAALIVISARSGLTVGAEKAVRYLNKAGIPFAFFINKMDDEKANYEKTLQDLRQHFGSRVTPMMVPILEDNKMVGFVNAFKGHAKKLLPGGDLEDIPAPEAMKAKVDAIFQELMEHVAESSEEMMEKFFLGESFTEEETIRGIYKCVHDAEIYPVFCGSAENNWGIRYTMSKLGDFMPTADKMEHVNATDEEGQDLDLPCDPQGPLALCVFKTLSDPFVGRLSFFRVYSGTVKAGMALYNPYQEQDERVVGLSTAFGTKGIAADFIKAGDIGMMSKLNFTKTGETLCEKSKIIRLPLIEFPPPALSMAILPENKGDEDKIVTSLRKIQEEDPAFQIENNAETRQLILSGVGEIQLDVIKSKLKNRFKVSCTLEEPRVPYRETILRKVKAQGKHKKQSGGHGQYGDVWIEFEHCPETERLLFEEKIFGGSVPKSYHPAVEKGLLESIEHGVLAGYPVVNLKATLVDGSYHDVDSSEMAFKLAAALAYRNALPNAKPVILEPISEVKIWVPDQHLGDIMSDLNKRRGRILGMEPKNEVQSITAEVPSSELARYATDLRSMTQGRAWFGHRFARYEQAPAPVSERVIAEAKAKE